MTKQLKVIYTHWINTSADPPKVKAAGGRRGERVISVTVPAAQRSDYTTAGRTLQPVGAQKFLAGFHVAMGLWKESV